MKRRLTSSDSRKRQRQDSRAQVFPPLNISLVMADGSPRQPIRRLAPPIRISSEIGSAHSPHIVACLFRPAAPPLIIIGSLSASSVCLPEILNPRAATGKQRNVYATKL
jgi:hypothetical protein